MAKVTTERIRETQTIARHLEISLQNLNRTAANFANFVSIDKPKRLRLLSLKFGSTNIYLLPAPHAGRPGRGYSFSVPTGKRLCLQNPPSNEQSSSSTARISSTQPKPLSAIGIPTTIRKRWRNVFAKTRVGNWLKPGSTQAI